MDGMSDGEFESAFGLTKPAFLEHLEHMAALESERTTRVGAVSPDFSAPVLIADGSLSPELLTLSKLSPKPTGLVFGCYTCPVFRRQTDRLKEIIKAFETDIRFLFIYVTEAHPTNGWNTPSNVSADIMFAQPNDMKERAVIAHLWRKAFDIQTRIVVDWPDNRINAAYSGSPERLYVLDSKRFVTFQSEQGPYDDGHLDEWESALRALA